MSVAVFGAVTDFVPAVRAGLELGAELATVAVFVSAPVAAVVKAHVKSAGKVSFIVTERSALGPLIEATMV